MSNNIHIREDCGYIIKKSKAHNISNSLHGHCTATRVITDDVLL